MPVVELLCAFCGILLSLHGLNSLLLTGIYLLRRCDTMLGPLSPVEWPGATIASG